MKPFIIILFLCVTIVVLKTAISHNIGSEKCDGNFIVSRQGGVSEGRCFTYDEIYMQTGSLGLKKDR